jgi:hypothetical protein
VGRSIPWYRKKRWWALIVLVAVIATVALGLHPFLVWGTKQAFARVDGYTVTFEDVWLQVTKANLVLTKFKVVKDSAGGHKDPFIFVDRTEINVDWRELLHGHTVSNLKIYGAKVNLISAKAREEQQGDKDLPDLAEQLKKLPDIAINRMEIRKSEIAYQDRTQPEVPRVWLHNADMTLENLHTRAGLGRGQPTIVSLSGTLQKSGALSIYVTADPLAKGLWFSGVLKVEGLDMKQFHDLIASRSGIALEEGTLDVLAEFECRGNKIEGGVRPVLKNPKVVQAKPGIGNWFKKVLADAGVKILSDRVPGRNAVATTVPIKGDVTKPDAQLWPTVLGVIRNAFVEGVSESFEQLPPPEAEKKQPLLQQAAEALNKKKAAPKTQPAVQGRKSK